MMLFKTTVPIILMLAVLSAAYPQTDYVYNVDDYDAGTEDDAGIEDEEDDQAIGPPPVFNVDSLDIKVTEGSSFKIPCTISEPTEYVLVNKFKKNERTPETLLYVGGMDLVKKSRFSFENYIITVKKARKDDSGTYTCHYQSNPTSELHHKVDVQFGPTFTNRGKDHEIKKGDSVTLECQASGNPKPIITWSRIDGKLSSGKATEEGFSITFENVDRHEAGVYQCTADNGIGKSISSQMNVDVSYPPEIITEKEIIRTGEGDKVELVCIVHARPTATIEWTKDGEPLGSLGPGTSYNLNEVGHRHVLEVSPVSESNYGGYQCSAENDLGQANDVIALTDLPREPQFTSEPNSAKETTYTVTWDTESFYAIEEYRVRFRKTKANESTEEPGPWSKDAVLSADDNIVETTGIHHSMVHTLDNLLPATDYQVKVQLKSNGNWGQEAMFPFSTKKASPPVVTSPPPTMTLAEISTTEEVTRKQTTSGSGAVITSITLLLVSFFIMPFCS